MRSRLGSCILCCSREWLKDDVGSPIFLTSGKTGLAARPVARPRVNRRGIARDGRAGWAKGPRAGKRR